MTSVATHESVGEDTDLIHGFEMTMFLCGKE